MNLLLDQSLAFEYHSNSQIARVMTEDWVARELYCPRCGNRNIRQLDNNSPVADFECPCCASQFELKSKSSKWGDTVNNGSYGTLIERITSDTNPDWLFMSYEKSTYMVRQLMIVPKHFFTPQIVERRKPLQQTARRAGWIGSTIRLDRVPEQGRVFIVANGSPIEEKEVRKALRAADALVVGSLEARGWLMDVLQCVNEIPTDEFMLADVYIFEDRLHARHPNNNNVRPKIRQQLQELRDRGVIDFLGGGRYRKVLVEER